MSRLDEIQTRLKTLAIEIEATKEQRERARAGYDGAAARGDQEGMKSHGARFDQCEEDLVDMQRERSDLQEEENIAFGEYIDGLTIEELTILLDAASKRMEQLRSG